METTKLHKSLVISSGVFPVTLMICSLIIIRLGFIQDNLVNMSPTLTCFYGISMLTLLIGILLLAGLITWQLFVLLKNAQKQVEKEVDNKHKLDHEKLLSDETEKRRQHEQICNRANDLSKLIAAGKSIIEKTDEKIDETEKPTITNHKITNKTIEKTEMPDSNIYMPVIKEYLKLINPQPNKESNV